MLAYFRIFLTPLLLIHSSVCLAKPGLGDIAENIGGGVSIVSEILIAACVVVGICLMGTAVTQYQVHRNNPKLVPLFNPILYLVLGTILACFPPLLDYLSDNDSPSGTYPGATALSLDIDAPVE